VLLPDEGFPTIPISKTTKLHTLIITTTNKSER
jgi:hypothetical protein